MVGLDMKKEALPFWGLFFCDMMVSLSSKWLSHSWHYLILGFSFHQRPWWFQSVSQFSHSVVYDSLQPHGLQHAKLPCLSPSPGVCSKSCPSSGWCHPTIWSSVIPFSSCLQSFPALGTFPMSQFFPSSGQSIGASASVSVLQMNIQDWSPLGLTGLIFLMI